jgi:hypothetical protein
VLRIQRQRVQHQQLVHALQGHQCIVAERREGHGAGRVAVVDVDRAAEALAGVGAGRIEFDQQVAHGVVLVEILAGVDQLAALAVRFGRGDEGARAARRDRNRHQLVGDALAAGGGVAVGVAADLRDADRTGQRHGRGVDVPDLAVVLRRQEARDQHAGAVGGERHAARIRAERERAGLGARVATL